jgi:hypothetical protein
MSLSAARGKLHESYQVVQVHWNNTREGWNDQVGRQFESDFWSPLEPAVQSALRALDRLSMALTQMKRDCE